MMQNTNPQNQGVPPVHSGTPAPIAPHAPRPQRPVSRKKSEGWNNVLSTVIVLLLAPVIALFLTAFVFQSYQVDGPSMETTLSNNDRLIVWKVPKTWARLTGNVYIPNRGDVIIFTNTALANYGQDPSKQLIKRVIGLPGERVTISNGIVTIYNDEHPDGFQPDDTLPYGKMANIPETPGDVDTVVPNNEVFVLGDNRPNSLDSSEFLSVDAHAIIGKLVLRVLPANNVKAF
jgi:signal peptidase I